VLAMLIVIFCSSGVTEAEFLSLSLSIPQDKSLLAQIKARRRSNIGARGSPETNSLIRFMAQQRMKTPPASRTPELVRSSPFLPRVASTLRQKMASFQMLMDVAESDACDLAAAAAQDGDTGGCIRTRDYLSGEAASLPFAVFADEDGTMEARRKKVRFGAPLSPEVFDKNLPPDTPLRKGSTPARPATPGGSLQLRSALKTPQRSASRTPQSQPSLGSPDFGASPTFSIPCSHRQGSEVRSTERDDRFFFLKKKNDVGVITCSSLMHCLIPLDLNLMASKDFCLMCASERGSEAVCAAYPQASSLFSQQPEEESQPVKRSTRSAAKSASTKMKTTSGRARQWSKDVDRSLYGSRAYASKNPDLSPIKELARRSQSQAAAQTARRKKTARTKLRRTWTQRRERSQNPTRLAGETPKSRAPSPLNRHPAPAGRETQTLPSLQTASRIVPVLQEQQNLTGEAAERQQGSLQSSQEEQSPSSKALAPWQDDFNFEDVFKPVATRGQRSVRRSLRLSSADPEHGAGLAWIPRNSPDERRKTRGRRLSAALPEETQDAP
uniref:PP1-binding domain-containing protein n=1 Tax=Salarias fasciatus TaxID=181472 RepID=A0A672IMN9_SALFA